MLRGPIPRKRFFFILLCLVFLLGFWVLTSLPLSGATGVFIKYIEAPRWPLGPTKVSIQGIFFAILLGCLLFLCTPLLQRFFWHSFTRVRLTPPTVEAETLFFQITRVLIIVIGVFWILSILKIPVGALGFLSGSAIFGLAFGFQKIAANFISGYILRFEKSIRPGDILELPENIWGTVVDIHARHTIIKAFDGREVLVPNETFITESIVNWSHSDRQARVDIPVGVAYGSDPELVLRLLVQAAEEEPLASQVKKPSAFFMGFGDNALNFLLFCWVDDVRKGRYACRSSILRRITAYFERENIDIPFPQRDLHLRSAKGLEAYFPPERK